MPAPSSRRRASALESFSALLVCAAVAAIGWWLLHTQSDLSPAVRIGDGIGVTPKPAATPAPGGTLSVVANVPASLRPMGAPESFTPATLSDKIDGKAEVYLAAHVAGMKCQRYALRAAGDAWLELFVFDMAQPANAFSVYSSQKRSDVTPLAVGDYGYRAGNQLAVVHGRFYIEIIGTDETAPLMEAAVAVAKAYVGATRVEKHADVRSDESLFPATGLVSGSVMLLAADVFGCDKLGNVFVAHYRSGEHEYSLFIGRRATAAEASATAAVVRDFFVSDCGGNPLPPVANPTGAVLIEVSGKFEAVFTSDALVAGVHQAPDRATAEAALRNLAQQLGGKP